MVRGPNSPKVIRDDTLRLATTHLAETAIAITRLNFVREIRQIGGTVVVFSVLAAAILGIGAFSGIDDFFGADEIFGLNGFAAGAIKVLVVIVFSTVPALAVLLAFKLKDLRQLNNRLIEEYELRRKYGR